VATSRSVSDSDEIVLRGVQEQRESAARLQRLPKGKIDPPIGLRFRFDRIVCSKVVSMVSRGLPLPS
jgi:hypothetical protein